jgi:hypothetical protein
MMPYAPVFFDLEPPARLERLQLGLRVLVLVVLGFLGVTGGWFSMLLYLVLPLAAAIVIAAQGPDGWLRRGAGVVEKVLRWLISFGAYMAFLSDRFPTGEATLVRFAIHPTGRPTVGSALGRVISTLPAAVVLAILAFVGGFVWVICAVSVLFAERAPEPLLDYQRGVLRWAARLCAYHASFVEAMPPLAIDGGRETPAT